MRAGQGARQERPAWAGSAQGLTLALLASPLRRVSQAEPLSQASRAALLRRASLAAPLLRASRAAARPPQDLPAARRSQASRVAPGQEALPAASSACAPISRPPRVRETPRAWPSLAAQPDPPWFYPRSGRRATFPLWDRCASRADAAFGSRDRSSRRISASKAPLYLGGCSRWPNPQKTSPWVTFAAFAAGSSAWHSVADVGLTGSGGPPVWCW
jgi:hypothetical protein